VLLIGSTCFGHYYVHHQQLTTIMLITTLVVSFCKDGGGSVNVKLWFLVVYVRCEVLVVLCRFVRATDFYSCDLLCVCPLGQGAWTRGHYDNHAQKITTIEINRNTLSATTKRQRTPHRTHTTKNHNFTLTLPPPSLQNETTNVVINIIVASS